MANSVTYVCVDQAALALGLAIVPLHVDRQSRQRRLHPRRLRSRRSSSTAPTIGADSRPKSPTARQPEARRRARQRGRGDPRATDARVVRAADAWLAAADGSRRRRRPRRRETLAGDRLHLGHDRPAEGRDAVARNVVSNVLAVAAMRRGRFDGRPVPVVPAAVAHIRADCRLLSADRRREHGRLRPLDRASRRGHARRPADDPRSRCRASTSAPIPASRRARQAGRARARCSTLTERIGWRRFDRGAGRRAGPSPFVRRALAGAGPARRARRSAPSSAAGCASRSPAARRCRPRVVALASWRWGSRCCRATA